MKKIALSAISICACYFLIAQNEQAVYASNTTIEKRRANYRNIINNTITNKLSPALTSETEEGWEDAFYAMALINYRTAWIDGRIRAAFDSIGNRSSRFQCALVEMINTVYPREFTTEVMGLVHTTSNGKLFARCAEFLCRQDTANIPVILELIFAYERWVRSNIFSGDLIKDAPILKMVEQSVLKPVFKDRKRLIQKITAPSYLPGNIIVYSFQRHNRNYPGIVMVRNGAGEFVKNADDSVFYLEQLARSISDMPFYLTNGNTPQGIFRMTGFDISKSMAIGPTANIQLLMPYETTPQFFLKDTTITDTVWTEGAYKKLLPQEFENEDVLYQTYNASKMGRTEIIAHGTTVDPGFYRNQPFYPLTPTEGCLCTKEIWDPTGKRIGSDQQLLVDAVKKAGNADGYLIVIELDDVQKAVLVDEVLELIKREKNDAKKVRAVIGSGQKVLGP